MQTTSGDETPGVKLLTLLEVAKVLRVSPATAYRMRAEGEIPYVTVRGRYRVRESDLFALLTPTSPAA